MALPTYAMSSFKFSKSQCQSLQTAVTKFWWQKEQDKRKIYWLAWKHLCKPKEEGGLGFKDFQKFNQALLAKQFWRLIQYPVSLLAKVYKSKYAPDSELLSASLGVKSSYGWQSLLFGRDLLLKGLRKQIADDTTTSVWNDKWLFDEFPTAPQGPENLTHPHLLVRDLCFSDSLTWNLVFMEQFINQDDIVRIQAIQLSRHGKDSYVWGFNAKGNYTVKSGYWLATHDVTDPFFQAISLQPNLNPLFRKVWKLRTEPRIKIFLWQILSQALPMATRLITRGMAVDTLCKVCLGAEETICHTLFTCPAANRIWSGIGFPLPEQGFSNSALFSNMYHLLTIPKHIDSPIRRLWECFPWLLWEIWKQRNMLVFQNRRLEPQGIIQKIHRDTTDWTNAMRRQANHIVRTNDTTAENSQVWQPPSRYKLKCNVDFSWIQSLPYCGAGWILRNNEGKAIFHGRQAFNSLESWLQAGILSLCWAVNCLHTMGYADVEFEVDSKLLFEVLLHPDDWLSIQHLLENETELLSLHHNGRFTLCHFAANKVAKALARSVTNFYLHNAYIARGFCLWFKPFLDIDKPSDH